MTSHLSDADRAELNRLWSELTAAQRIIERLLGDDDPTGLRYDRGDGEGPTGEQVRPHDGFHVTGRAQRPINSPAGFASTERRTRPFNGRPGAQQGEASLRGLASPTLRVGVA